jgi:meiotically up-regulated gene 157 (Mug157) protein
MEICSGRLCAGKIRSFAGVIEGVIRKQISCILSYLYANVFNEMANEKDW